MARCELHGQKCAAATRRLLPCLRMKKSQALISLDVGRLRRWAQAGSAEDYARLESARQTALSLNYGSWTRSGNLLPVAAVLRGYGRLGPVELGWTKREIHAYLGASWTATEISGSRRNGYGTCSAQTTGSTSDARKSCRRQHSSSSRRRSGAASPSGNPSRRMRGILYRGACTTELRCALSRPLLFMLS